MPGLRTSKPRESKNPLARSNAEPDFTQGGHEHHALSREIGRNAKSRGAGPPCLGDALRRTVEHCVQTRSPQCGFGRAEDFSIWRRASPAQPPDGQSWRGSGTARTIPTKTLGKERTQLIDDFVRFAGATENPQFQCALAKEVLRQRLQDDPRARSTPRFAGYSPGRLEQQHELV